MNMVPKPAPPQLGQPELPFPAYEALDLTEGGQTALITLNGQIYTLRITRSGKLILTK